MLRKSLFFISLGLGLFALGGLNTAASTLPDQDDQILDNNIDTMTVWQLFERLGKIKLHRLNPKIEGASAEKGRELVHTGQTTDLNGKKTARQSKFFVCTACHNTSRETDNLKSLNPEERLAYAQANKLPFLQGSSFFGIVNRVTFYNNDYQKKYADAPDIKIANRDIRKAIQLCATQCAQGRPLEDWEIESILAYFWTLELKVPDLKLNEDEVKKIDYALNESRSTARAIHIMEAHYADRYPATFVEPMPYRTLQYPEHEKEERMARGQAIYDLSCKHCHANKRYSFYALDDSKATFKQLNKRMQDGHAHSVYKITRNGTSPQSGKRAYMPLYPMEKLSNGQLDDLRLYIQERAK